MKNITKIFMLIFTLVFSQITLADTTIGKVYGKKTWTVYVKSKKIYIRIGSSSFADKCSTGFKVYDKYVQDAYGKSYYTNKEVLTGIQRYLVKGKYSDYGCA